MGRKKVDDVSAGAGASASTDAHVSALPTWRAKLGLVTIRVSAQCWYDARNEAVRRFRASPMDVACESESWASWGADQAP
jgi:hypothetical protein